SVSYTCERTYESLVGAIGEQPRIWAECCFVDPVADIAVLRAPDNQELAEQHDAYQDWIAEIEPTFLVSAAAMNGPAWILSLDGQWRECKSAGRNNGPIWTSGVQIEGGMSGSPIVGEDGGALGVVVAGTVEGGIATSEGGWCPVLLNHLPGW